MNSSRTRFGLIRHAPTLWNEEKRIQGQQDSPLSSRGKKMAAEWGKNLRPFKWDFLLCSDLPRVLQTAALINVELHLPDQRDNRLREQNWGAWTGMTMPDLMARESDLVREQEQKGWDFRPPGGESRREVLDRGIAALAAAHTNCPDQNILVVCHEGMLKCLLYHLLGREFLPSEPPLLHGYHLHMLSMEGTTLSLEELNCLPLTTIRGGGDGR